MRVIGWILRDDDHHALVVALCGDGTVVFRDCFNNEWRVWGDQSLNEGSLQIQQVIESWDRRGYDHGEPLNMAIDVDPSDLTERDHSREYFDDLFQSFLDMAGISPTGPAVRTIHSARLVSVSLIPPTYADIGDMWFDNSADSAYTYSSGSWRTAR